jgi:hypothetical protein
MPSRRRPRRPRGRSRRRPDQQRPGGIDAHISPSRSNSQTASRRWRSGRAGRRGEQVARMRGPAARVEIGRRGRGGEALHARADRHRDHVLLQPFVVADAGVAAGRQHVDEAVLGDHLEPDVGIGGEEGRHDRGQHQPRGADRNVEPQRAGRLVAKAFTTSSAASTSVSAGPSRSKQARAGLGRRDAARGAVEQPDAELRLQPPHRLAQAGRADAAGARPSRKPLARATATKAFRSARSGFIVRKFRTPCADCTRLSHAGNDSPFVGLREGAFFPSCPASTKSGTFRSATAP